MIPCWDASNYDLKPFFDEVAQPTEKKSHPAVSVGLISTWPCGQNLLGPLVEAGSATLCDWDLRSHSNAFQVHLSTGLGPRPSSSHVDTGILDWAGHRLRGQGQIA